MNDCPSSQSWYTILIVLQSHDLGTLMEMIKNPRNGGNTVIYVLRIPGCMEMNTRWKLAAICAWILDLALSCSTMQ